MKTLKFVLAALVIVFLSSCVQETHKKTIHFKLDMNAVENPLNVGVRGGSNPLSWRETLMFTDDNNDGVYEGSIELQSASYDIEFKFVNQHNNFELEDKNNRTITFDYKPETIIYEAIFNITEAKTTKTN